MTRVAAVLAAGLGLVAASGTTASAGGYLGIGVGTNAVSEATDKLLEDGRSVRLLGGSRWGRFAIEGMLGAFGLGLADRSGAAPLDGYQLALAAKYSLPLADAFHVYGRGGAQRTWATGALSEYDVAGTGFLVGAGFEIDVRTGIGSGSIWVDYQVSRTALSGDRFDLEATTRQWTLGVTVAL
jgi:hypothetical protein